MIARLSRPNVQFVQPRLDPRYLATDSRCAAVVAHGRTTDPFVWSDQRAERRACNGVSPYTVLCASANRPRWVNPQRCAIAATVLSVGFADRRSRWEQRSLTTRTYAIGDMPKCRRNPSCSVRTLTWHCRASVEVVSGRCAPASMMSIALRTATG